MSKAEQFDKFLADNKITCFKQTGCAGTHQRHERQIQGI